MRWTGLVQRGSGCEARPGTRDAGAAGRKASGGLSAVGRLPDTRLLRVAGWSRWGGRAGGGVGAPHLGPGGGLGGRRCALLTLPPPPPAAAGMWLLRGSQSQQPRVRGGVWTGLFSYPLESVGWILWIPCPPLALPFPPPRALCSVPAGEACGFAVWDRLFFGQISTCKECPASKLTAWAPTGTHPHPRACCPPCPDN